MNAGPCVERKIEIPGGTVWVTIDVAISRPLELNYDSMGVIGQLQAIVAQIDSLAGSVPPGAAGEVASPPMKQCEADVQAARRARAAEAAYPDVELT